MIISEMNKKKKKKKKENKKLGLPVKGPMSEAGLGGGGL